ncbi:hypothetical protein IPM62_04780 [Candidatus Woesebacteria bacterium]|nr:MAG: hypothetical protein IPM62_04780 [Candidatus Woesebacteria bacterium]
MAENKIGSLVNKITTWFKLHKVEGILLVCILLLSTFLRLYKIGGYMTFLGDEGRDAIIVRRFLTDFDLMLIGPGTSIGNMYLGPLYYYMMAPALFVARFSPVGPAVMIALLGIFTNYLVWYITKKWFPVGKSDKNRSVNIGALIAAFFYAIAPTVIIYSKSSWNPNIMPFFSIVAVFSIWKVWKAREYKWLMITGFSLAGVVQSHYLGLILFPVIALLWILTFVAVKIPTTKDSKQKLRTFMIASFCGAGIFTLLMSPLVIFDARHNWINFSAMKIFFTERQTTLSVKPWSSFSKLLPISNEISSHVVTGYNDNLGLWFVILCAVIFMLIILKIIRSKQIASTLFAKNEKYLHSEAFFVLFLWFVFALIGLGVYKQEIYDHYFGFLYPALFIMLGGISQFVFALRKKIITLSFIIFLVLIANANIVKNPLKYSPNDQLKRSEEVSQRIVDEAADKPFNIAVIAERNYEGAYQYYLERKQANFKIINAQKLQETVTDQLFVVCELPKEKCDPTHNGKAEVANFGWSKIEKEIDIFGITLYKLVHSNGI